MNPDPRLTAYALGELAAAEREAFERDLAASAELQAELQSLTPLCDELMKTLSEPDDLLTETQRDQLRHCASGKPPARPLVPLLGALAAAGLIFAFAIFSLHRPSNPVLVAENSAPHVVPPDTTPPATPSVASAAKIPAQLAEGEQFFKEGHYDLAFKRGEQVLLSDRSNIPARRLMERANVVRQEYAATAGNETRSRLATSAQVGKAWEMTVTRHADSGTFVKKEDRRRTEASELSVARAMPVNPSASASAVSGNLATDVLSTAPVAVKPAASRLAIAPTGELTKTVSGREFEVIAKVSTASPIPQSATVGGRAEMVAALRAKDFPADVTASPGTESYDAVAANGFLDSRANPLSTFSIDVDTASYANVRRFLTSGQRPPADAVRIEELINYFPYNLPAPDGDAPFSVTTEVSRAPWNAEHLLARIALKGRDLNAENLPASNLVFLVDVSGSMDDPNKLPLLKRALRELVQRLSVRDRVAIVTYAGSSGLALPSTDGRERARILDAIDRLEPGGSTNGAAGIQLAYNQARDHFASEGNNRVILCTDGDFNVGVTSRDELTRLIERERKSGVFLSVLGFGTGNLKDATMENLADRGNGNYAYIDSPAEGRKVLIEQMGATLFTIAKDVKIQVEFNPATVAGYRLIGYENRLLAKEDFNDDTKDAGEIGAGHAVTALYEIVPAGGSVPGQPSVDPLKYQRPEADPIATKTVTTGSRDLFTVKLRFKAPDGDTSKLIEKVVGPESGDFSRASADFRFATAVAAFGMKLRGDRHDATLSWSDIQRTARESLGDDPGSYRAEFLVLVEKAKNLGE